MNFATPLLFFCLFPFNTFFPGRLPGLLSFAISPYFPIMPLPNYVCTSVTQDVQSGYQYST